MGADLKKEDVDAMIRETLDAARAEFREELQSKVKEAREEGRRYVHPLDDPKMRARDRKASREKGVQAGRYIRLLAGAKGDLGRALARAKHWNDDSMVEAFEKSLNESVLESGGALVPGEFMDEVTDLLRARVVVRASGAPSIPMNSGSITIPYQSAAATASYIGELQAAPVSQPQFGLLNLTAKKLAGLVPVSNDLLKDASPRADAIVRDDLVRVLSIREDLAFIRDDGTSNTPKGLRHQAIADNVFDATGTALADKVNDLHDAM